jgi:hypothetical protein
LSDKLTFPAYHVETKLKFKNVVLLAIFFF